MILANGCNITKSEKVKGVWILSVPTVIYINTGLYVNFFCTQYWCHRSWKFCSTAQTAIVQVRGVIGQQYNILIFLYHNSRFYHDSLSCWFYYFASCLCITAKLMSLYCKKKKPFKVTKYKIKKNGRHLVQSGRRKNVSLFYLCYYKIRGKYIYTHYKYTYYTNKTNSALFLGCSI